MRGLPLLLPSSVNSGELVDPSEFSLMLIPEAELAQPQVGLGTGKESVLPAIIARGRPAELLLHPEEV